MVPTEAPLLADCVDEASAIAAGYTVPMIADSSMVTLELLVKPDTDLDSRFAAFDRDAGELLSVNGWMFGISPDETNVVKGSGRD